MVYKEWRHTWSKFAVVLIIYIVAGVVISTLLNPAHIFTRLSIFHQWVIASVYITIGAAIIAGADTIAEENGKSTLSFLLTRPLSRTTIYTVKFLVNALTLLVVLVVTSLVMFFVEQIPQGFIEGSLARVNGTPYDQFYYVAVEKMTSGEALGDLALVSGLGMIFLAVTALISIYTRSAVQAIISTLFFVLLPFVIIAVIDSFLSLQLIYKVYIFFLNNGLVGGILLLAIAAGIFAAGLKIFKAKEF